MGGGGHSVVLGGILKRFGKLTDAFTETADWQVFKVGLPVTRLAKWKTGIQMVAIPMLMVADYSPWFCYFGEAGEVLIWIAAVFLFLGMCHSM